MITFPITYYHKVTFKLDENTIYKTVLVKDGATVTEPTAPSKEGYEFKGWQLDESDFDFDTPITQNTILLANFEEESSAVWEKTIQFEEGSEGHITSMTQNVEITLDTDSQYEFSCGSSIPLIGQMTEQNNIYLLGDPSSYAFAYFSEDKYVQIISSTALHSLGTEYQAKLIKTS